MSSASGQRSTIVRPLRKQVERVLIIADIQQEGRRIDDRLQLAKRGADLDRHLARRSAAFQCLDVIVELRSNDGLHQQPIEQFGLASGRPRQPRHAGGSLHGERQILVLAEKESTYPLERLELAVAVDLRRKVTQSTGDLGEKRTIRLLRHADRRADLSNDFGHDRALTILGFCRNCGYVNESLDFAHKLGITAANFFKLG